MRYRFVLLVIGLLLTATGFAMSPVSSIDRQDVQDLEKTVEWIFEQGYSLYEPYKDAKQNSKRDWEYNFLILNKHDVGSNSIVPISKHPNASLQATFAVRKGKFALTLDCYRRIISDSGKVYEYWHKKKYWRKTTDCSRACRAFIGIEFIFTEADDLFSERKIVHQSNKFSKSYQFADGVKIDFPVTPKWVAAFDQDMDVFPAAFKDTPFEGRKVKLDRKVGWVWAEKD
jgi:hypothetical protein